MLTIKHNPITILKTSKREVPGNYCLGQRSFDVSEDRHRARYSCT